MKFRPSTALIRPLLFLALALLTLSSAAKAQRDYFTPEEVELIRDAQEIDRRIDVLIHAIDRRFKVLHSNVPAETLSKKDSGKWGELPTGSRAELLYDIKRILEKAINDIDNLAERPDSAVVSPNRDPKDNKGYAVIFPKAVKTLAKAAERYQPALKAELDTTKDNAERGSILESIDMCDQIIAAVPKLPTVTPKKKGT